MDRSKFIQGMNSNIELSDKERRRIIRKSVETQPWRTKCTIAMEEFAELQQQVSKQIRGYDDKIGLLKEMADAYIGLEFLKSIFNISEEDMQKAVDVKLERERRKEKTKMIKLKDILDTAKAHVSIMENTFPVIQIDTKFDASESSQKIF